MSDVAGKVAFVTGGGSGIGQALAEALAAEGGSVVVADIAQDRAAEAAAAIERRGGSALGVACDVSDRRSVAEARARAVDAFGPPSLLFANAGVTALQPLVEMSPADIDWILSVDLLGVVYCLEAFLPDMVAARSGHVVATSSSAGLIPESLPIHAPYAAAKAGLIGLMLNLRQELAESSVGCTVVCPGGVATRIGQSAANRPERFGGPSAGGVTPPQGVVIERPIVFRQPAEVAQMVLRGVRDDRPMVLTDASWREKFVRSYVDLVLEAFEQVERFDEQPRPAP